MITFAFIIVGAVAFGVYVAVLAAIIEGDRDD